MSAQTLEAYLALLLVDPRARERFLTDPRREAEKAGLSETECASLESLDRAGLEMAARSFTRKRQAKNRNARGEGAWRRWAKILAR
jgi:hypothetical protein